CAPIAMQPNLVGRYRQCVAGRHAGNAAKKRLRLIETRQCQRRAHRIFIKLARNIRQSEQAFRHAGDRGKAACPMEEEGPVAKMVSAAEQAAPRSVPNRKRKTAADMIAALCVPAVISREYK